MGRMWQGAAALGICLVLGGCGFRAPAPKRTEPPSAPQPPLSTISLRLAVPAADIARLINRKTETHIADIKGQKVKCGIGRCKLDLRADRTGPVVIAAHDGGLSLHMPFRTDMRLAMPGLFSAIRARADANGEMTAFTAIGIGQDWRLHPRTEGEVRLYHGRIRLGPIVTNVAEIWNDNADTLSRSLFRDFDKQIAKSLRVEDKVRQLWARSFQPIPIGKKPLLWLQLSPQRVRLGDVETRDDTLILSLGVEVRARAVAQDAPPAASVSPLPPPAPLDAATDRFSFSVPVLLPYHQAADLALAALKAHPPQSNGRRVRVETLDILPSGEDVVIKTKFCVDQKWDFTGWFSACGDGYLRGVPRFDAKSGTVRILNVRYDFETENLLMRVARGIAAHEIRQAIATRLTYDLSKDIAKMRGQIETALAKPQGREVTIKGQVERFADPSLTWTKDGFLATIAAEGRVQAEARL